MCLYKRYVGNSLQNLYGFGQGEFLERVTDDFQMTVSKIYHFMPSLCVNLLAVTVYFFFIGTKNRLLAVFFLLIAVLQMLPELAVRNLPKKIYDENRDVEARITNLVLEAYRGFSVIKTLPLRSGTYIS